MSSTSVAGKVQCHGKGTVHKVHASEYMSLVLFSIPLAQLIWFFLPLFVDGVTLSLLLGKTHPTSVPLFGFVELGCLWLRAVHTTMHIRELVVRGTHVVFLLLGAPQGACWLLLGVCLYNVTHH